MIKGRQYSGESGRSMTELIIVLALMGLLSAITIPMLQYATNKSRANEVIHEGRIVQMESLARQGPVPNEWQPSQYKSDLGLSFFMRRDVNEQDYVKVEGIERDVCRHMLNMQKEGTLVFLTEPDYTAFTECQEGATNTMVFAFDGLGVPSECKSENDCQQAHAVGWYCDQSGHCIECDPELSDVNEQGDGCACKEYLGANSCSDNKGHTWCCGRLFECGEGVNECSEREIECETVADCEEKGKNNHYCDEGQCVECGEWMMLNEEKTACICDATQAVSCDDGTGNVWCCGTSETGEGQICDYENNACKDSDLKCQYEIKVPTDSDMVKTANCSYSVSINGNVGTMTPIQDCLLPDEYCYLAYSQNDCKVDANASTSIVYGNCIKRIQGKDNGRICNFSVPSANTFATETVGCPVDQYCYLKWQSKGCASSNEANANTTGQFYGVCVPRTSNSFSCPYNNN